MQAELLPVVQKSLDKYKVEYRVIPCDPELADTAAFCEAYGYKPEQSANTIVVTSRKIEPTKYVVCVLLATTKLDVNKTVASQMGVKRASFADAETTIKITGMEIDGVTAAGIANLPIFVDSAVMNSDKIIMGGGNRISKVILKPAELLKLPNVKVVENLAQ